MKFKYEVLQKNTEIKALTAKTVPEYMLIVMFYLIISAFIFVATLWS